ncbi:MAG: Hsp20/alpha crystallin family protein [Gemmatimonadota bacterium]|nr:Hsp20/alpha crystallin family protein [Gemmatimonadota bacterium]
MQVTKFNPMWSVLDTRHPNRLGRLYEQMLESGFQRDENRSLFGHGMPPVDVIEERDTIRLVAELPGVRPEDVRISVEGNVLTLQGEKKEEERQDDKVYRFERTYGMFERSFTLPTTIDASKIVAKFESGLLTVLLPKVEAAKPRQITVTIE